MPTCAMMTDAQLIATYERVRSVIGNPDRVWLLQEIEFRASRQSTVINPAKSIGYRWMQGAGTVLRYSTNAKGRIVRRDIGKPSKVKDRAHRATSAAELSAVVHHDLSPWNQPEGYLPCGHGRRKRMHQPSL